jgi:hypothetical protein
MCRIHILSGIHYEFRLVKSADSLTRMRTAHYFLLFIVCSVLSCSTSTKHEFILPQGFKGKIKIWKDPSSQTKLILVNNKVTIFVPANGELAIQDDAILGGWHETSARYSDGSRLTCDTINRTIAKPNEMVFWSLGTMVGGSNDIQTYVFFVGMENEARQAWGLDPLPPK